VQILQPGYKVGDRILRPARVAVAEPGGDSGPQDDETPAGAAGQFLPDEDAARGGTRPRGSAADDGD
jgi:molecular chaperone GrpE